MDGTPRHMEQSVGSPMETAAFWGRMQTTLRDVLAPLVPRHGRVVLIDYPVYRNVGDLLIHLGTLEWLREREVVLVGAFNMHNFRARPLGAEVTILCAGGGNFGDLYDHQEFRERVVRRYPGNRIVQLPQTIHYEDAANLERSAHCLNAHQDLHLLLRDGQSADIAAAHFFNAKRYLAPDMASFLYPMDRWLGSARSPDRRYRTLYLLRRDRERSVEPQVSGGDGIWQGDWADLLGAAVFDVYLWQALNAGLGKWIAANAFERVWRMTARRAVIRCARAFLRADAVVTSRLHGHILATLLDRPNTLLDNSYGKNANYFRTWCEDVAVARFQKE